MLEKWAGAPWDCHVRQMSWHCFSGNSVLGCLRSKHASAKRELGACWNWNIITTKQDYLEQWFQMGLEMTLCYSEIIGNSSSGGRNVKLGTLFWEHGAGIPGIWPALSRTLSCWEILGTVLHWAGGHLGQKPEPIKALCSGVPCSRPSFSDKKD